MARLPVPGSDDGNWGTILNDFLTVEHDALGALKIRTDGTLTAKADDSAVVHNSGNETIVGTKTFSTLPVVPATPTLGGHAASKSYVDSVVSAGAPDATTGSKGIIKLAGDLAGTADLPTVPGLAGKQPLDSDLTTVAGLAPTNDDVLQRKAGAWTNRTPAQLKLDLSLTKSDIGLTNVPNTDATDRANHTGTQTASTISDFTEAAQDAVGGALADSNTVDFTYNDGANTVTADTKTQMSVTSDASGLKLAGDATTPGNTRYYGTDGAGTKGYFSLPSSGETNTASNAGAGGVGVFKQKTGTNLEFKNINAGSSKVTITNDTTNSEVDIDVAEASLTLANLGGNLAESRITNLTTDLSAKEATANKNAANGYLGLDANSRPGVGLTDVQTFTATGTWTKPANANVVYILVFGGGGGGGSGRRGAAASARGGGGGAAGGGHSFRTIPAALLSATETVTVGAGGAGGPAITTDSTDGSTGTVGGPSWFKATNVCYAGGGAAGNGGTATGGAGGTAGTGMFVSNSGGAGGTGAAGAASTANLGPGGGGGGAGISAGDAVFSGGAGAGVSGTFTGTMGGTAGTAGGSGGNGNNSGINFPTGGGGAGGGASSITGVSGSGGSGGTFGAAGGGGAASVNGNNSGAGGTGSGGIVVVISY
jgi:hypothetical protein